MVQIEFNYLQIKTLIQVNPEDKFETAANQFANKTQVQLDKVVFLSNGSILSMENSIKNIMNIFDRQKNKTNILVIPINTIMNLNNNNIINYNNNINNNANYHEVICPICKESCKFEIKNYRITLSGCKNGHKMENIKISEYINYQKIDFSKIFCDICKIKNREEIPNKEFYICLNCNQNLCPSCKNIHNNIHEIINYDLKKFLCEKHNKFYSKHCNECNKDICLSCENEHKEHNTDLLKNDLTQVREKMNILKDAINKMQINIKEAIKKLNKVIDNMELLYDIHNNFLSFLENNNVLDYNQRNNLNFINSYVNTEIRKIKYKYNYGKNIYKLLYIYNDMEEKNISIEMKYIPLIAEINGEGVGVHGNRIRIFGKTFVDYNKDNCIIVEGKNGFEYEMTEFWEEIDKQYNNKEPFSFRLKGINNITSMKGMFSQCDEVISLPDISKFDTSNIIDMSYMFSQCNSLTFLSDISKLNTSNVIDMSSMFSGCNSIKSLPDISKWNTSNVLDMKLMFNSCVSLLSLPDISKWVTFRVTDMNYMFINCRALKALPNIENWDTDNIQTFRGMFHGCNPLLKIPMKFKH